MDAAGPRDFKHTTIFQYPEEMVGITLLDEEPGYTGIYLRDPQGGLYPARTVCRASGKLYESVIAAWLAQDGEHQDLRTEKE